MRVSNTGVDLPEPAPANDGANESERVVFAAALAASPPPSPEQAKMMAGQAGQLFESVSREEGLSVEPLATLFPQLEEAAEGVAGAAKDDVAPITVPESWAVLAIAATAAPLATAPSVPAQVGEGLGANAETPSSPGYDFEPANSNSTPLDPQRALPRPQVRDLMAPTNASPMSTGQGEGDANPGVQNARVMAVVPIDGGDAPDDGGEPSVYGRGGAARVSGEPQDESVKAIGDGQGGDLSSSGERSDAQKAMSRDAARAGASSAGSTPLEVAAQLSSHVLSAAAAPTTTAPSAATPVAAPPPPAAMAEQLAAPTPAADIRFVEGGAPGQQSATVELMHPELGPIQLRIQMQAQTIDVRAITASLAASQAIRAGESSLREDVSKHGVKLRGMRVEIEGRDESRRHRRVNRKNSLDMEA